MKHDEAVMSVDFSPNNEYVVSATWGGTIRIWNAADGEVIRNIPYSDAQYPSGRIQ